ncbi:MAG: hypothetical protein Q9205_002923 [Flavoplaca limonia]
MLGVSCGSGDGNALVSAAGAGDDVDGSDSGDEFSLVVEIFSSPDGFPLLGTPSEHYPPPPPHARFHPSPQHKISPTGALSNRPPHVYRMLQSNAQAKPPANTAANSTFQHQLGFDRIGPSKTALRQFQFHTPWQHPLAHSPTDRNCRYLAGYER